MKNLGTMYLYELKKIGKRKLTWIMAVILAIFCIYSIITFNSMGSVFIEFTDENGVRQSVNLLYRDIEERIQKDAAKLNGQVMDDAFFASLRENVPNLEGEDLERYFLTKDATYRQAYSLIDGVGDPLTSTAEEYYNAVEEARARSWERQNLSEGEKRYWKNQQTKIQTPYVYEHPWTGTAYLIDHFYNFIRLLPLAAAACLCGIFSEDRRTRVNALVFSSKNSRFPLYLAKVLAGLTSLALLAIFLIGVDMGTWLVIYGGDGFNAAIQLYDNANSFPITIGEFILFRLLWFAIFTVVCGCVTMLVSVLTHSTIAAFVAPVLIMTWFADYLYLPASRITDYLPTNLIGWNTLLNYHLVNLFGVRMNGLQFAPLLYGGIAIFLIILCGLGWRHDAVPGK